MKMHFRTLWLVFALLLTTQCGPEVSDGSDLDPEETFTAFCETLFACPEAGAVESYGSQVGCEDVHRMDYEDRDSVCREAVLVLEDCLAGLSCHDLVNNGCGDLRLRLGQQGCWPL